MKDRVKQVQDHYRLSQKQYATELGVAEATISSVYRGRTAPTNNLIQAIHNAYPAVNINWLMFGEGDMLLPLSAAVTSGAASDRLGVEGGNVLLDAVGQKGGFSDSESPTFFDAPATPNAPQNVQKSAAFSVRTVELQLAEALSLLKKSNEVDKPVRKIKEIRVFFDDGTFETFAPSNK